MFISNMNISRFKIQNMSSIIFFFQLSTLCMYAQVSSVYNEIEPTRYPLSVVGKALSTLSLYFTHSEDELFSFGTTISHHFGKIAFSSTFRRMVANTFYYMGPKSFAQATLTLFSYKINAKAVFTRSSSLATKKKMLLIEDKPKMCAKPD